MAACRIVLRKTALMLSAPPARKGDAAMASEGEVRAIGERSGWVPVAAARARTQPRTAATMIALRTAMPCQRTPPRRPENTELSSDAHRLGCRQDAHGHRAAADDECTDRREDHSRHAESHRDDVEQERHSDVRRLRRKTIRPSPPRTRASAPALGQDRRQGEHAGECGEEEHGIHRVGPLHADGSDEDTGDGRTDVTCRCRSRCR